MADWHLAQINIGRLVAPLNDPRIAEFVALLAPINALADQTPGFVWRLQSENGNATEFAYNEDPSIMVNMSVWESVDALRKYVYASQHIGVFRQREKWFEKMDRATYCLWWIPAGHRPTISEGRDRLEHYREHGATPFSFWFSQLFPAPAVELVPA
ncbi:MAG TPA: DUF3291 domain-containing protein [Bryobacteraceae bacterium]|nr:DUF3291 domain-containing protein [Bryobacteraceae bacterium]